MTALVLGVGRPREVRCRFCDHTFPVWLRVAGERMSWRTVARVHCAMRHRVEANRALGLGREEMLVS